MEIDLNSILEDKSTILKQISKNQNLPKKFYKICEKVENDFKTIPKIENLKDGKEVFESLDELNHIIPELLTIRRERLMSEKKN